MSGQLFQIGRQGEVGPGLLGKEELRHDAHVGLDGHQAARHRGVRSGRLRRGPQAGRMASSSGRASATPAPRRKVRRSRGRRRHGEQGRHGGVILSWQAGEQRVRQDAVDYKDRRSGSPRANHFGNFARFGSRRERSARSSSASRLWFSRAWAWLRRANARAYSGSRAMARVKSSMARS